MYCANESIGAGGGGSASSSGRAAGGRQLGELSARPLDDVGRGAAAARPDPEAPRIRGPTSTMPLAGSARKGIMIAARTSIPRRAMVADRGPRARPQLGGEPLHERGELVERRHSTPAGVRAPGRGAGLEIARW